MNHLIAVVVAAATAAAALDADDFGFQGAKTLLPRKQLKYVFLRK